MRAFALVLASGCSFGVSGLPILGAAPDLATPAPDDGGGDAADLASAPDLTALDLAAAPDLRLPFCSELDLVGCWTFEDGANATVAIDGTANHEDLTLTNANEVPTGAVGGGLSVHAGSLAHRAHDATQDIAQLTVEMHVNPAALPDVGARAGLADQDGQWGLFVYNPGVLTCFVAGVTLSSPPGTIVTNQWQHVACTYDLQNARLYYNGVQIAVTPTSAPITTGQPNGLSIGMNSPSGDELTGVVDDVRIFAVARDARSICLDAAVSPSC